MALLAITLIVSQRVLLLFLVTQLLQRSIAVVFNWQAWKHQLLPPPSANHHEHQFTGDSLSAVGFIVFRSVDDAAARRRPPAWEPGEEPRVISIRESGDTPECVVCMSEMGEGEEVRQLRCGHAFHRACVDEWVCGHGCPACPLCRCDLGRSKVQQKPAGSGDTHIGILPPGGERSSVVPR